MDVLLPPSCILAAPPVCDVDAAPTCVATPLPDGPTIEVSVVDVLPPDLPVDAAPLVFCETSKVVRIDKVVSN